MKKAICLLSFLVAFTNGLVHAQTGDTAAPSSRDTSALQKMICKKWTPLYVAIRERERQLHPGEPSFLLLEFTKSHKIMVSTPNSKPDQQGAWALDPVKMTIIMTMGSRNVDIVQLTDSSLVTQVDSKLVRPDLPRMLLKTYYKPSEDLLNH